MLIGKYVNLFFGKTPLDYHCYFPKPSLISIIRPTTNEKADHQQPNSNYEGHVKQIFSESLPVRRSGRGPAGSTGRQPVVTCITTVRPKTLLVEVRPP